MMGRLKGVRFFVKVVSDVEVHCLRVLFFSFSAFAVYYMDNDRKDEGWLFCLGQQTYRFKGISTSTAL